MKFAFLLSGVVWCGAARGVVAAPIVAAAPEATALEAPAASPLPPAFVAGDLTITPVQAGFDYPRRIFPGESIDNREPIFTCTFRVASAKPNAEIGSRLVLRRMIGPRNQYVAPFELNKTALQNRERPDIYGFTNAEVDPNWPYVDLDLDVLPAPAKRTSGQVKIDEIELPAPNGEVAVNRTFTGDLGTQFNLVKIRRDAQGALTLVLHEQRPAAIPDLEIADLAYSYQGATPNAGSRGGGGLPDRFVNNGETEIVLGTGENETVLKNFALELFESAPSLQNRAQITRKRLRFPLQQLRATQTIAPLAPSERVGAPRVVGRAQNEKVRVVAETDGLERGNTAGLTLWMQATPADTKRGVQWNIANGSAQFAPGGETAYLDFVFPDAPGFWHSDGTTRQPGETGEQRSLSVPPGAQSYDLKLDLQGRLTLKDDFVREIEVPLGNTLQTFADDEDKDHALILRKVQRFSRPEDLNNGRVWDGLPKAGVLLVFEKNPVLPDSLLDMRAFDAEDDLGRAINRDVTTENRLFIGDYSLARDEANDSFYSLILGAPAADAKSIRVWLGTVEKTNQGEETTLEIKGLAVNPTQREKANEN